jgi:hypothetical protein
LMAVLQSIEAKPTASQIQAVVKLKEMVGGMVKRWEKTR